MTTPVALPLPLGWAPRRPATAPTATAAATSRRIPLVVAENDWFFEGTTEAAEGAAPVERSRMPWVLAALPLGTALVTASALLLHVPVTAGVAVLATLVVGAPLALRDRSGLIRDEQPSPVLALFPPAYLAARALRGRDPRPALAWFLAAAASAAVLSLAMDKLAPVDADSRSVQDRLLSAVLMGDVGVDPARGQVRCPAFSRLWPDQIVTCTAWDTRTQVPVEVSASAVSGISWHVAG